MVAGGKAAPPPRPPAPSRLYHCRPGGGGGVPAPRPGRIIDWGMNPVAAPADAGLPPAPMGAVKRAEVLVHDFLLPKCFCLFPVRSLFRGQRPRCFSLQSAREGLSAPVDDSMSAKRNVHAQSNLRASHAGPSRWSGVRRSEKFIVGAVTQGFPMGSTQSAFLCRAPTGMNPPKIHRQMPSHGHDRLLLGS